MDRTDVKNCDFYRSKISKRCAVKCLIEIAEAVMPHGSCSLHSSYFSDSYDNGIYNMVSEIKRLEYYANKYHALQNILKETVK